jgi:tetratricopeptide (TPR) repeat protein/tRNA A-37 threonylcarbamoyl transferase component Bud32
VHAPFTPAHWETIKEIFACALELRPSERELFVREMAQETDAREQILRLLGYSEHAVSFFARLSAEIGLLASGEALLREGDLLSERFSITRFIAKGGMGEVYEADDLELGEHLALKVMRRDLSERAGSLQRFRDEIRLARKINDPHVCRVYDVARDPTRDLVFFSMELLPGETLLDRISTRGPLTTDEARPLIRQMALGLHAAHRFGVLHRDFKSSNVLICPGDDGARVVITDFGLSRLVASFPDVSDNPLRAATPAYVAPEQLQQHSESLATDIYSFGVVLFEMMTGDLPFTGESAWDIAQKRLFQSPIPPRRIQPELPQSWENVILRCLALDPAKRYVNVLEVADALGCMKAGRGLSRRVFWMLAVASVASPAILVWKLGPHATPHVFQPPVIAVLGLQAGPGLQYLADGIADRVADDLASVPGIRVIARSVTRQLPQVPANTTQLSALHATHSLSGRVERGGEQTHINVALAQVGVGPQIWSATFDLNDEEIEGISRRIARGLIHGLHLDSKLGEPSSSDRRLTDSAEAYQLYLLGRYHAERRDTDSLNESVVCLERAVALDPQFAAAYAALGASLHLLSPKDGIPRAEYISRANDAAERALKLDSQLAEAHLVIASNLQFWDWEWRLAEEHFRKAIELAPNLAMAHHWYSKLLYPEGRFPEALTEIGRALELDPFDRSQQIARGTILLDQGRVDEAISQYRMVVSYDPAHSNAYVPLSCAYAAKGLLPEAIEAASRAIALTNRASFALSQLGHLYALSGQNDQARKILAELEHRYQSGMASACEIAAVYAGWRESSKTLEWLARAIPARDTVLTILKVDPQFAFLRSDLRLEAILVRVRLSP